MSARLVPVLGLVGLLAMRSAADEAPKPTPPAPPAAPEAAPATPEPKPLGSPQEVWTELQKEASDPAKRNQGVVPNGAKAYLEAYAKEGRTPQGADLYFLAQMLQTVRRFDEAAQRFQEAADCPEVPEGQRLASAVQWVGLTRARARDSHVGKDEAGALVTRLDGWMPLAKGTARGNLLAGRAQLLAVAGRLDEALTTLADAGEASPDMAASLGDEAARLLLEECKDLAQVAPARAKLAPVLARLTEAQKVSIENAKQALAALAADAKERPQAETRVKRAEAGLVNLAESGLPLRMLGAAAPEWTLVKAYGQGKSLADYRGKVVVLDFWATWCPWCIKSFPALRDLLKDYAGKDLAVVGITTSSSNVYDQRYDLDDDLKSKASASPVKPVLQRPRPPAPLKADADDAAKATFAEAQAAYEKALAEFPAKEHAVIATFVANHAMTWDVVQIDPNEPGPKYALGGWPHCVVIDREGRVRHFKSGALLREKPEAVAHFRAVLDRLLAEPAATK